MAIGVEVGEAVVARAEERSFSGVVRIDRAGEPVWARAFGAADRRLGVATTVESRFGLASAAKGLTALTVVSMVEDGLLTLDTTARSLLGDDLPLIDDAVTVEHLLAHRSGIGDYLDEESDLDRNDYVMTVPVHRLAATEGYLPALTGFPQKFAPGTDFSYCNGGYVVLALLAERASGRDFYDLVQQRVLDPAGMSRTAFLRSDELPGDAAIGYLEPTGLRTNVLHLPVRGSGDGGVYAPVADVHRLWSAIDAGGVVAPEWCAEMVRRRSQVPDDEAGYGLGFWLELTGDGRWLTGSDAGVSFCSWHSPAAGLTWTVASNVTSAAWPLVELLDEAVRRGSG